MRSYRAVIHSTSPRQRIHLLLKTWQKLEIHHFFDGIYGSSPEAPHKADVIHQALQTHQLVPQQAIIIGDTKFDMLGARETGIQKLAVTWGFGEQADLLNYQPDYIAHKPLEVLAYFQ